MFDDVENEEQLDELVRLIILQGMGGIEFKSLYNKATFIENLGTMSRLINQAVSKQLIIKHNNRFFHPSWFDEEYSNRHYGEQVLKPSIDLTQKNLDKVIKNTEVMDSVFPTLKKKRREEVTYKTTPVKEEVKPKAEVKKTTLDVGMLVRESINGEFGSPVSKTAMALYVFRKENTTLTVKELSKATDLKESDVRSALNFLLLKEYAIKIKSEGSSYVYRWSDKYEYPFKEKFEIDNSLIVRHNTRELNYGVKEHEESEMLSITPEMAKVNGLHTYSFSKEEAVNWYDYQIAVTEQYLASLKKQRDKLTK